MKYLFLTLFIFTFYNSTAQSILVSDMLKIMSLNDSEIEVFLNDKGCVVDRVDQSDAVETTKYYNYKERYWVGISNYKEGCKIVHSDFENTNFYNLQKKEVVKLDFKYLQKNITNQKTAGDGTKYDSIEYVYVKGKTKVSFYTNIFQTRIQYEIAISTCN